MKQHNQHNQQPEETRFCPFKKAQTKEYNQETGLTETHERFEVCAGERCVAYCAGRRCALSESRKAD